MDVDNVLPMKEGAIFPLDVAALYGVKTKEVNQAVYNNPDKFPSYYMFELSMSE
ncbi:MAG: ORF6N domain-containing protein [Bacteroidales bacterium]|nr:ORF6N domain-containing protein [Bacteroidales bacterium]